MLFGVIGESDVEPLKNPGTALILGLIWPGVGHLYAGRTLIGLVWMVVAIGLGALAFTIIGLIVTIPCWIAIAMLGKKAAERANHKELTV